MTRRLPFLATLLVGAAVALMIALGFWQLSRLHQKQALLTRYADAERSSAEVPFPRDQATAVGALYRRSRLDCTSVTQPSSISGRDAAGRSGIAHVVQCGLRGGGSARVVLGWSPDPGIRDWRGGLVTGIVAPGPRLVADPPLVGLAANARPDPANIPNNHLSYAVQWFLFALTAAVIYALALRGRPVRPGRPDPSAQEVVANAKPR